MRAKKSSNANLEKQRSLFLLIGFVVILGIMYIAFEWSDKPTVYEQTEFFDSGEEEMEMIQTQQENTPPPPPEVEIPPVVEPEIVVVEKEVDNSGLNLGGGEETGTPLPPPPPPAPPKINDEDEKTIFTVVDKNPEFPGGVEALYAFLSKNINYPSAARETGIQGRVFCQFVVNTDGSIVDVQVVKGVDPDLDAEAIAVIKKMPKWKAGEQNKKKVRVRYTLPIVFKIG